MSAMRNSVTNPKAILVTVIYAGVFSYSLGFWDVEIVNITHIIYLFFACALLIADWFMVYAQQTTEYNKTNFFLFDIAILFIISRVISASSAEDLRCYWGFMSLVFLLSTVWDAWVGLKEIQPRPEFNWKYNFIGDLSAAAIIAVFYFTILKGEASPYPYGINTFLFITCSLAVANWFKPLGPWLWKILTKLFVAVKGLARLFHHSD